MASGKRRGRVRALVGLLALLVGAVLLAPGVAYAEQTEGVAGYWKLVKSKTEAKEDTLDHVVYRTIHTVSEGRHEVYYSGRILETDTVESATFVGTCTSPDPIIPGGSDVVLSQTLTMTGSNVEHFHFRESTRADLSSYGRFDATKESAPDGCEVWAIGDWGSDPAWITSAEVHAQVPEHGYVDGRPLTISFSSCEAQTVWTYEWVDSATALTTKEDDEWEEVSDPLTFQNVTTDFTDANEGSSESRGIVDKIVEGFDPTEGGLYVAVPVGIALVGGVLYVRYRRRRKRPAQSKAKEEPEKRREPARTYRMVVSKDFGSGFRPGGKFREVRARIEEGEGREGAVTAFRPSDLTKDIVATGVYSLVVRGTSMRDGWMCASVGVPASRAREGQPMLDLSYVGKGGHFNNRVKFRLLDPRIVFDRKDGIDALLPELNMVAGAGGMELLGFAIEDAEESPIGFDYVGDEGLSIAVEPKAGNVPYAYEARIQNVSHAIKKVAGIFASPYEQEVTIRAHFDGSYRIESAFRVTFYPEGLSVQAEAEDLKDDRLIVNTVPEYKGEVGSARLDYRPTRVEVTGAYVDESGLARILRDAQNLEDEGFVNAKRYGKLFEENFNCRISVLVETRRWYEGMGIEILPSKVLPLLNERKPYDVGLRLSATDGIQTLRGDLPILFLCDHPDKCSTTEWKKAFEDLRDSVGYYGVGSEYDVKLAVQTAERQSAAQLEFIRKNVIAAGVKFNVEYEQVEREMGNLYHRYVVVRASLMKCGDLAIEFCLEFYTKKFGGGVYGKMAAKFLNLFKNLLCEFINTCIYGDGSDGSGDGFAKLMLTSTEEALEAFFTALEPPSADAVGKIIAAYLMVCFIDHYNYDKDSKVRGDIYRSLIAAVGDLAFAKFKQWIEGRIKAAYTRLANTSAVKKANEWIGRQYGAYVRGRFSKDIARNAELAGNEAYLQTYALAAGEHGYVSEAKKLADSSKPLVAQKAKAFLAELENQANKAMAEAREALVREQTEYAREMGELATANMMEGVTNKLDLVIAQALNAYLGGKSESGDALGADTKDVIVGYIADRYGLTVSSVMQEAALLTLSTIPTVGVDGRFLVLSWLGMQVRIDILENIQVISSAICELLFGCLEGMCNAVLDIMLSDDPRDRPLTDTEIIEQQARAFKAYMDLGTTRIESDTARLEYDGYDWR